MITLPPDILNSNVLTKEHLHLLAGVDELPVIDASFKDDMLKNIVHYYSLTPDSMEEEIHRYATRLLDTGNIGKAWQVLLAVNVL